MAVIRAEIRWASNTAELKKNIAEGIDVIDAMKRSVDRTTASLGGDGLIRAANQTAAAIAQLGGVEKLTNQERERALATFDKAIEKYAALGRAAPTALTQLADSMRESEKATINWSQALTEAIEHPLQSLKEFAIGLGGSLAEGVGKFGVALAGIVTVAAAAGVGLFELAEKAAKIGANLNDMGEKTGIAVPQLSRLSNASAVAGTDIERLSNLVFMMEKNMGQGGGALDKVREGVEKLHISWDAFQKMSPGEQLMAIANGAKAIEDPVTRNSALFEIFGRQVRDQIPALMKLNEAMEMTADIRPWTDQEAKDAEAFEMKLSSMKIHVEALATAFGRELIPVMSWMADHASAIGEWLGNVTGINLMISAVHSLGDAYRYAVAGYQQLTGGMPGLPAVQGPAPKLDLPAGPEIGMGPAAMATAYKELNDQVKKHGDAHTTAGRAAKEALRAENQGIKEVNESMNESEREMMAATAAIGRQFAPQLKDLRVQLGFVALQSRQTAGIFPLIADQSAAAAARVRDGLASPSLWSGILKGAKDAAGGLNDIFMRAFEGGGGVMGAVSSLGTRIASSLLGMIPIVGPILSQFAGAIMGGIRALFGGPSQDELSARKVFEQFQAQFGTLDQTIQGIADAYMATGHTAAEAEAAIQKALAATHKSAQDVQQALIEINKVLDAAKNKDININVNTNFSDHNTDTAPQPTSEHEGGLIPRAHRGMLIMKRLGSDEVPIIAQAGEAVLNRRAVSELGSAAVHAMNSGAAFRSSSQSASAAPRSTGSQGSAGTQKIVLVLPDGQVLASTVLRHIEQGGSIQGKFRKIARQAVA